MRIHQGGSREAASDPGKGLAGTWDTAGLLHPGGHTLVARMLEGTQRQGRRRLELLLRLCFHNLARPAAGTMVMAPSFGGRGASEAPPV